MVKTSFDAKAQKCKTVTSINLRCKHEAEEEGPPQVPVPDLFAPRVCVYFVERIDHDSQLLPDPLKVAFL